MPTQSRIKVLFVAPQPPPLGGMVTYIQGLLSSDISKVVDSRVVRFDYLGKERYSGLIRVLINFLNSVILTLVFVWQTLTWQPHLVHIQTNSGFGFYEKSWLAVLAKLMARRTLMHVHGGNFREFYIQSPRIIRKIIRWCGQINDRIVTASPQMRATWQLIGLPDVKIKLIGNAVNLPVLEKEFRPHDGLVILFLTRIIPAKGIIELIDAACSLHATVESVRLRIVGAEELETSRVKNYIAKSGAPDFIQYVGPVTEEQKHNEYSSADIFAFPTHVEDQSYAVMEAMSYGLPCVASNVGGVPSLVCDEQNGLLVQPQNVDALLAALERLVNSYDLRKKLGVSARKTIETGFTWEYHAKEMVALYRSLVNDIPLGENK